jgi:hypothetical protein
MAAIGLLALLVGGGEPRAATLAPSAMATLEMAGRAHAGRERIRFSPDEERRIAAVIADAQQTRAAAVAYFDAQDGAAAHAAEIDELVAASVRARLVELLGAERGAIAARRSGVVAAAEMVAAAATP